MTHPIDEAVKAAANKARAKLCVDDFCINDAGCGCLEALIQCGRAAIEAYEISQWQEETLTEEMLNHHSIAVFLRAESLERRNAGNVQAKSFEHAADLITAQAARIVVLEQALDRARTYVELSVDETDGEESAEAKHDLSVIDAARSTLKDKQK